jgi:hypothetical protein
MIYIATSLDPNQKAFLSVGAQKMVRSDGIFTHLGMLLRSMNGSKSNSYN